MPQNLKVKIGEKYGRLTVVERAPNRGIRTFWKCLCDCGTECEVAGSEMVRTNRPGVKSCGCLAVEKAKTKNLTHGMSRSLEFRAWSRMRQHCDNEKEPSYQTNKEKGISYAEEWASFENFYNDMGPKPAGYVLGRLDVNKSFDKENCRWMTQKEVCNNRTNSVLLDYKGEKYTYEELSKKVDIKVSTLKKRIKEGMTAEEAVEKPVRGWDAAGQVSMRNQKFSFNGEEHTITKWAAITGIPISTLYIRLASGWEIEKALTTESR